MLTSALVSLCGTWGFCCRCLLLGGCTIAPGLRGESSSAPGRWYYNACTHDRDRCVAVCAACVCVHAHAHAHHLQVINSLLFHALRKEGGGGLSAWASKAAVGRGKLLVAFVLGATHAPANYLPCANVVSTRVAPAVSRPAALLAVTLCACHRVCMLNRCDVV